MFKRVIIFLLDSVGIGELPDAYIYNDIGSDTIGNIARAVDFLEIPNLRSMGYANIRPIKNIPPIKYPIANYGKMNEKSKGKDSTTGHWEIAGLFLDKPFPTYPNGFPPEIIQKFEKAIGRKVLGNKVASGTVIINELGDEHVKSGKPIVYTSADSVFQIAAHEEIIPVKELYEICEQAREILQGKHGVGRVIARPFLGKDGDYSRTPNRKDFSLQPTSDTILDYIKKSGRTVFGIGKIEDLYAGKGLTDAVHTKNNLDGIKTTIQAIKGEGRVKVEEGLIFTNLVDFDMKWGHRNDFENYAKGLMQFDSFLPEIFKAMKDDDILFITADHGCDPTTKSTDHSREYVPILAYSKSAGRGIDLGIRKTFADLGQTIAENFKLPRLKYGESFFKDISIPQFSVSANSKIPLNLTLGLDFPPNMVSQFISLTSHLLNQGFNIKMFHHDDIYNTNLEVELNMRFKDLLVKAEDGLINNTEVSTVLVPFADWSTLSAIDSGLGNSNFINLLINLNKHGKPVILGYRGNLFDDSNIPYSFKSRYRELLNRLKVSGYSLLNFNKLSEDLTRFILNRGFKKSEMPRILTETDIKEMLGSGKLNISPGTRVTPSARDLLRKEGFDI